MTRQGGASGGGRASDILRGMFLLGRGDASGIGYFGGSVDSFLTALAPGVALRLVATLLILANSPSAMNATKILLLFCGLLLPPIVTHALAVRWGCEKRWLRYATASLWCEWLVQFVFLALALVLLRAPDSMATAGGIAMAPMIVAELYDLWLRWFVARTGLGLGRWRAVLLVIATTIALVALYGVALLLPPHYMPWKDMMASLPEHRA